MSRAELPRWDATAGQERRCRSALDAWGRALVGSGVVAEFSGSADAALRSLAGSALFDGLEGFAAEFWDFRRGRERNLAEAPDWSGRQRRAVDAAASVLGLEGTAPPRHGSYDAVVLTGGMVRAGIVKPRFLRELHERGLAWREGVFLGAFRPFAGDELELATILGVEGEDEFDSMVTGMRLAFGLEPSDDVVCSDPGAGLPAGPARWRQESWRWRGRMLRVLAAPSSDPEHRRANTLDTFRFWARRAAGIRSVLVITTPVYVPYQAAGAVEVLGLDFGLRVETVAVSARASDLGELSQPVLSMHRAQELRSAIHGMRRLRRRLDEREPA